MIAKSETLDFATPGGSSGMMTILDYDDVALIDAAKRMVVKIYDNSSGNSKLISTREITVDIKV